MKNAGTEGHDIVRVEWADGPVLVLQVVDGADCPFLLRLFGENGSLDLSVNDGEAFYRRQLEAYVRMLETGEPPFPASETLEILNALSLAERSRQEGGTELELPRG